MDTLRSKVSNYIYLTGEARNDATFGRCCIDGSKQAARKKSGIHSFPSELHPKVSRPSYLEDFAQLDED